MSIGSHDDWSLSERGKKDAERHRKKIDDSIRKNVKDVISEESIITKKRGKKIRIPVRGLKDYQFKHGQSKGGGAGAGSGHGEPGDDLIPPTPKDGKTGDERAGDQPGDDYMEVEVDIDYLIEIMFKELGLPFIEEKTKAHQLVPKGWKFDAITKKGPYSRIHKKRSLKESIKRTSAGAFELMRLTGCSEDDAFRSLVQSKGDIKKALDLINNNEIDPKVERGWVFVEDDDLRYKQIEEDVEIHSNAVVIAMMDTSGSMTVDKKYLARSLLFWLVEFLKKEYEHVQIVFITHTTDAKRVDENEFFYKGESGGTFCSSAFELANYIIDTEFPLSEWNVYCMHISDGDNWSQDNEPLLNQVNIMLNKKINMLGYVEIKLGNEAAWSGSNMALFKDNFDFKQTQLSLIGVEAYKDVGRHFYGCIVKNKDQIYPALKHFLFEKRKK